jgi:hypothetical protein
MSDWDTNPVKAANDFFGPLVPGMLGCEFTEVSKDLVVGRIHVTDKLIAGTGYLFAPAVIALADTPVRDRDATQLAAGHHVHDDRAQDELPRLGPRG